jgi:hypothetical protein
VELRRRLSVDNYSRPHFLQAPSDSAVPEWSAALRAAIILHARRELFAKEVSKQERAKEEIGYEV